MNAEKSKAVGESEPFAAPVAPGEERFENHMRPFGYSLQKDASGDYVDAEVRGCWSIWKAASASGIDDATDWSADAKVKWCSLRGGSCNCDPPEVYCGYDRRRREFWDADLKRRNSVTIATPPAPAKGEEAPSLEVWNGDRKVTIYLGDCVMRIWGSNINDEMSDEPYSAQAVHDALRWLFAPAPTAAAEPREPLTDEQIDLIAARASDKCPNFISRAIYIVRETERAHGIATLKAAPGAENDQFLQTR